MATWDDDKAQVPEMNILIYSKHVVIIGRR